MSNHTSPQWGTGGRLSKATEFCQTASLSQRLCQNEVACLGRQPVLILTIPLDVASDRV